MSKWDEKWSISDSTHDVAGHSNESRADEFVSKSGDGENHCHLWVNKETGESGVEHRGACKVCDDVSKESSSSQGPTSSSSNDGDSGGK